MNAAIYARRSTEQRGADAEAKSVILQINNARAFAAEKGWTVAEQHIYSDDAVSGADVRKLRDRQRLLDVIRSGAAPFQALIVREQSRFSRRDGDEAFAELKQIALAGVQVWFYRDRTRFAFGSFGDNVVSFVKAEAAADYRRQIANWTYDAMTQKARAGFVTGGRVFGYDNVRVDGHVERRINETEAAVVLEIFRRAAAGEGLKTIAKALNADRALAPQAQQGRPRAWAPSSIREILHRETYRGVLVWNKTKKRDAGGEQHQHGRPPSEWIRIPAEHLRIVAEPLWKAVHDRRHRSRSAGALLAPPLNSGRGIRRRYLLSGFGRCSKCGGSMQAVSRASSTGRNFRYVCATYWNRGATTCDNGLMADLQTSEHAVRETIEREVLRPHIIERAFEIVIPTLQQRTADGTRATQVAHRLSQLDRELANLADTVAHHGAVAAVLDGLTRRDAERRQLAAELAALKRSSTGRALQAPEIRARLNGFLRDWQQMLGARPEEARGVLDAVLEDRIRFEPDVERRRYLLRVPIAFDRVLAAVVPEWNGSLQEMVASPTGFEPVFWP